MSLDFIRKRHSYIIPSLIFKQSSICIIQCLENGICIKPRTSSLRRIPPVALPDSDWSLQRRLVSPYNTLFPIRSPLDFKQPQNILSPQLFIYRNPQPFSVIIYFCGIIQGKKTLRKSFPLQFKLLTLRLS